MTEPSLAGASAWEAELYQHLQEHAKSEEHAQSEYRSIADSTPEHDVRFLIELILEDEIRHHRLIAQLSDALRSLVKGANDPPIPWLSPQRPRPELLAATKEFLAAERDDLKELKRLQKELRPVEDTTLWALVVRLLVLDTGKHIEILRFIEQQAAD
ncbi:MAG: hypothetical protein ABSD78_16090 [Acidimicrobiales bacterium]|jgi:hypothetical protein